MYVFERLEGRSDPIFVSFKYDGAKCTAIQRKDVVEIDSKLFVYADRIEYFPTPFDKNPVVWYSDHKVPQTIKEYISWAQVAIVEEVFRLREIYGSDERKPPKKKKLPF